MRENLLASNLFAVSGLGELAPNIKIICSCKCGVTTCHIGGALKYKTGRSRKEGGSDLSPENRGQWRAWKPHVREPDTARQQNSRNVWCVLGKEVTSSEKAS